MRRALAGAAGDEEQRPPLRAVGREVLDVEGDRPRDAAGPVERDRHDRALKAGGLTAGGGGRARLRSEFPAEPVSARAGGARGGGGDEHPGDSAIESPLGTGRKG